MRADAHLLSKSSARLPWPLDVLALLDEHHLCAWSDRPELRSEFQRGLVEHCCAIPSAEVLVLSGADIRSLDSFCNAVLTSLASGRASLDFDASIDGKRGVCAALRAREHIPAARQRFIIWVDAHVMLADAPADFGRAVDALLGTAAENEMVGDDLLLLQRVVFVGRAALDLYSEDPRGQFVRWFSERGEAPLWSVVTGLPRPRVRSARIESLLAHAH